MLPLSVIRIYVGSPDVTSRAFLAGSSFPLPFSPLHSLPPALPYRFNPFLFPFTPPSHFPLPLHSISALSTSFPNPHPFTPTKDVRHLVTAERHLPPKYTNFGFFTIKVYKFWVFYHQSVQILGFLPPKYTNFIFF